MEERPSHKRMSTNVNRGLAWIGVASSLVGILDILAILLILNNWVTRDEYGIATLVAWIFPILDQATDLGLSAAVIQREDHDDTKISTVFWINLGMAVVMFALLAGVIAPLSSYVYGHTILFWMMFAYGSKLLFQNVYFIPVALMKRELRFKELSIIRILANLAEFVGKVGFAAAGFGIWCFVLGPLCRVLVTGIGAQLRHPWRPKFVLRLRDAREYVTFGIKSSGSQILYYFYTNIDYPIVGYFFGTSALGTYRMAYEVVLEPVRMISNVVVDIAFPTFARLQHAKDQLMKQLVSFTRLNIITVMAYSCVVFVAADDVLATLFPKYIDAATTVRILCIVAILRAVGFVIPPLLDGVGRPDRTFNYMLSASILLPLGYVGFAIAFGSLGYVSVAMAWAVGYPLAFGILIWLATHTLGLSVASYFRAVAGTFGCLLAAGVAAFGVHLVLDGVPPVVRLLVTAVVVLLVAGLLLAYTQGLSLRSAMRAVKAETIEDDPIA